MMVINENRAMEYGIWDTSRISIEFGIRLGNKKALIV
jgi:hypothetical protein